MIMLSMIFKCIIYFFAIYFIFIFNRSTKDKNYKHYSYERKFKKTLLIIIM